MPQDTVDLSAHDMKGATVWSRRSAGQSKITIPADALSPGSYILRAGDGISLRSKKISLR
ncbi:MAG: hypothetical protein GF350_11155 [Chitinivibrionales bacterium]|nr:hypothetical protein [Chitinivibrionales bacterium]